MFEATAFQIFITGFGWGICIGLVGCFIFFTALSQKQKK